MNVCCSHYRFAASFLSGFKKQLWKQVSPISQQADSLHKLSYCGVTSFCVVCAHVWIPLSHLSELHQSPGGCCQLAEHRSVVCSVCKPVHAADKLLVLRYPLIKSQNTQIDSAAGDWHTQTHIDTHTCSGGGKHAQHSGRA